ncbi:MAG: hypothetical protein ACLSV2_02015 [Clostridium sp.]
MENEDSVYKAVQLFYGLNTASLNKMDIVDILTFNEFLKLYIYNTINKKLDELNNINKVESKKSLLDDYDEENGYNEKDVDENAYTIMKENINYFIKYGNVNCKTGLKDLYAMNLYNLLDYLKFNIIYENEHKEEENTDIDY